MHAEKCPVCYGNGSIKKDNSPCHGCSGKGWICVPNNKDAITIPYIPCYPTYPSYPMYPWWEVMPYHLSPPTIRYDTTS